LRMYINDEEVQVQQLSYSIPYGYEYYRPYMQPVYTYLTEKMIINTFKAFSSKQGLIVDGPDSTGKTETIRQISCMIGTYFKNYTCTADVEPTFLMRFLTGVCLTGVWGCMDSFPRLTFEMMSLVFQKCMEIKTNRLTEQLILLDKASLHIHKNLMFFIARDL
jgi:midasin (ATPase involved in ribosome maturation)